MPFSRVFVRGSLLILLHFPQVEGLPVSHICSVIMQTTTKLNLCLQSSKANHLYVEAISTQDQAARVSSTSANTLLLTVQGIKCNISLYILLTNCSCQCAVTFKPKKQYSPPLLHFRLPWYSVKPLRQEGTNNHHFPVFPLGGFPRDWVSSTLTKHT